MIHAIDWESFKCFDRVKLPLKRLTLFTGLNAAGKSTAIQPLLLLAQTVRLDPILSELSTNGYLVNLGTPGEIINQRINPDSVSFGIDADDFSWCQQFFVAGESPNRHLTSSPEPRTHLENIERYGETENLRRFLGKLIYVGATRHMDRHLYPAGDTSLAAGECGPNGEFAPWLVYLHGEDAADAVLSQNQGGESETIRKQLNGWMSALFVGAEANVSLIQDANRMRLVFRTSVTGEWQRPANVGYGLSYAFPVIAAGVLSSKGQTLIVDSPEAHLHPKGQSLIGRFTAQVASSNRQMLVETHSDHYLNGVRLAVRDGLIGPEDVGVYFFKQNDGLSSISELAVDKFGNLSAWPEGFFDQAERDLAALSGWA